MKRILAIALVVVMTVALFGCSNNKRQIVEVTLSTEDSEAILAAAGIVLPDAEATPVSGTTIKWYAWYDSFHNYEEEEIVNTGFWTFKEKYGCDIEWIECEWGARFDGLANLVLSGNSPDFYPAYSEIFPTNCMKGIFVPVDDYIDYDDPLWAGMKGFADKYFKLGDKHYVICTDNSFGMVVPYNRRVLEEWGFDDPAELYYNDEWTWDVFYEMCLEFTDPEEDRFGVDGWGASRAFFDSSGAQIVHLDTESGKFVSNLDDPRLERISDMIYNLSKNECFYPLWRNWNIRNGTIGAGVKEGLTLFFIVETFGFTGTVEDMIALWGDVTQNAVMFAPLPRDPNGDGIYYMQTNPSGYCLVSGTQNPEGVALFAACDRFKILDPTVISIDRRQLQEKYLWTDEMLEMYDECYELAQQSTHALVDYELGMGDKLNSAVEAVKTTSRGAPNDAKSWAQSKEANSEKILYYVEELNINIEEFIS